MENDCFLKTVSKNDGFYCFYYFFGASGGKEKQSFIGPARLGDRPPGPGSTAKNSKNSKNSHFETVRKKKTVIFHPGPVGGKEKQSFSGTARLGGRPPGPGSTEKNSKNSKNSHFSKLFAKKQSFSIPGQSGGRKNSHLMVPPRPPGTTK